MMLFMHFYLNSYNFYFGSLHSLWSCTFFLVGFRRYFLLNGWFVYSMIDPNFGFVIVVSFVGLILFGKFNLHCQKFWASCIFFHMHVSVGFVLYNFYIVARASLGLVTSFFPDEGFFFFVSLFRHPSLNKARFSVFTFPYAENRVRGLSRGHNSDATLACRLLLGDLANKGPTSSSFW